MKSSLRRFWLLWLIAASFCSLLVGWQFLDQKYQAEKPGILFFLDRHWSGSKQKLQTYFFKPPPSLEVQILELKYSNRYEFWFDTKTKKDLVSKLKSYPGIILANLDPLQMEKDEILRQLFRIKNFIRPYRISFEKIGDSVLEEFVTRDIQPSVRPPYGERAEILPKDKKYYSESFRYGHTAFSQDLHSNFVFEYPLTLPGIFLPLPSAPLAALSILKNCDHWTLTTKNKLDCRNQNISLPNPLPLFFYAQPLATINSVDHLKNDSKILVLDIVDATTPISTFQSDRTSWGQLAGTALTNMIDESYPWTNAAVKFLKVFLFLIFSGLLVFASLWLKLASCLTLFVFGFLGLLAADLIASVAFNIRTDPIEILVAFLVLGVVAIATRSILDFNERSLIERALSGYVSEERLRRLLSGAESLKLTGQKTYLTTLLIDIVGFSKIVQSLKPEEVFVLIQKFFKIVDPLIFKYGGAIDKKTGDGLLAFFGDNDSDPTTAAKAAIESGLEIQQNFQKLSASHFGLPDMMRMKLRIGINSGEMIIGNAGSEKHFNYTVFGEVVNFTQRLETACLPEEVLIGAETATLVENNFELIPTEIQIKNEVEKIRAFRVLH